MTRHLVLTSLFALTSVTIFSPTTLIAGDEPRILLDADGLVNGQQVDSLNFSITVAPGETIAGTVNLDVINIQPSSSVVPVAATVTWGDRTTQVWPIATDLGPPGQYNLVANVDVVAPQQEGIYYIVFGMAPTFTAEQVMSATNANCGTAAIWNDGNDLGWDWGPPEFNESRLNGNATLLTWTCPSTEFVPAIRGCNWIEVVVDDAAVPAPQILLGDDGILNGQQVDNENYSIQVSPGELLVGSVRLTAINIQPSQSVVPVAATVTWGDRTTQVWSIATDLGPPGQYDLVASVDVVAPQQEGIYYIVFGMAPTFTAEQVMSATNANCGAAAIWNDGNDLGWDWGPTEFNESRLNGNATLLTWSCPPTEFVPAIRGCNWIEVVVANDPCRSIVELVATDSAEWDGFSQVAIQGDTAVVGASNQNNSGNNLGFGKAYVFEFDGVNWNQQAELLPSDPESDKEFGGSVAIDGDTIVIGAPQDGGGLIGFGAAYVFVKPASGWSDSTETAKLTASDRAAIDVFGQVGISGDVIVVGALNDDDLGQDSGAAYVFHKPVDGWTTMTETAKLLASDGTAGDRFGRGVAISSDTIVIGADQANAGPGAAYVIQDEGGVWTEVAKLIGSDSSFEDHFGKAVDVQDNLVCIGAFRHGELNSRSGAAYIFEEPIGGWNSEVSPLIETKKLEASPAQVGNNLGISVAISEDQEKIVLGAYAEESSDQIGAAYEYRRPPAGWGSGTGSLNQSDILNPPDRAVGDRIGGSVDVSGPRSIVGASRHSHSGIVRSGGVWVFDIQGSEGPDCNSDGVPDACEPDCNSNGVPDECDVPPLGELTDCNSNFIPDECEQDCNENGIPDDCDVPPIGQFPDCNQNQIPDSCELSEPFQRVSPDIGPVGMGAPAQFFVGIVDPSAGDVQISIEVVGDLGASNEYLNVSVNGQIVGQLFDDDLRDDCVERMGNIIVPVDLFNSLLFAEQNALSVGVLASDQVTAGFCAANDSVRVTVAYDGLINDCNRNEIPDECDSDMDGDGVPDDCITGDCNGNLLPDETELVGCDGDPACSDCNENGILDECDIAFGGLVDCQSDGIPDECQGEGLIQSTWAFGAGQWSLPENWCPQLVPNNDVAAEFEVSMGDGFDILATLDVSPSLRTLEIGSLAVIEMNENSGANVRSLQVDTVIRNRGFIRATDRERLLLDAAEIDQGGICGEGGVLEAKSGIQGPGEFGTRSVLEINGARVLGGTVRAVDADSEVRLIGGAELVNACVEGAVVPDGQSGSFEGTIINEGLIVVGTDGIQSSFFAPVSDQSTLRGDGQAVGALRLNGEVSAQVGSFFSAFTNDETHRIDGAGILFGVVTNRGEIDANQEDGEALSLFPPGPKINSATGTLKATNNGVLVIADNVIGNGQILSQGGEIHIKPGVSVDAGCIDVPPGSISIMTVEGASVHASAMNVTGGIATFRDSSDVTIRGTLNVCPAYHVDSQAVAEVQVMNSSIVVENLICCDGAKLEIDGVLTVTGSYLSGISDGSGSSWTWSPSSVLQMNGGVGLSDNDSNGYAEFEVAGKDLGIDPTGFADNFVLPSLTIGPSAHVTLVDCLDNGNRVGGAPEALYVEQLVFADAEAILNKGGLNIYFNSIVGSPSQIVDLTSDPIDSLEVLVAVLLGFDNSLCRASMVDFDLNGVVDGNDIQAYVDIVLADG